jgi:hypothetical protein
MSRPGPPSGATPPAAAQLADGTVIDLRALAVEICRTYRDEFPDERERYGEAGVQWCVHDNQYLLAWAIQDARDGTVLLRDQAIWLRDVLEARDFPRERLRRNLELAAAAVADCEPLGNLAATARERLLGAADAVIQVAD